MAVALELVFGSRGWQTAQLDLSPQGIDDPQYVFQSQGGFARFKFDYEAHAHPRRQGQLGLCQPELLTGGTHMEAMNTQKNHALGELAIEMVRRSPGAETARRASPAGE